MPMLSRCFLAAAPAALPRPLAHPLLRAPLHLAASQPRTPAARFTHGSVAAMAAAEGTNADLSAGAVEHTARMEWAASPMAGVWRKRVFHTGTPEAGRVTSVVKYGPGSSFRSHPHPEGEEIYVLSGVFSDVNGDHTAGTLLLNPEGFEHAPSSAEGCEILVRLRQYPGTDRPQVALNTASVPWEPLPGHSAVQRKQLFRSSSFGDWIELQRWEAGASDIPLQAAQGLELFVVSGSCERK
mmetsp:Transcript_14280/g.36063  ORF Transcript_14280/g.36063 Transcript_14280/m.36063 type:complete len:240 (+) Transcript_14280:62-781(+)